MIKPGIKSGFKSGIKPGSKSGIKSGIEPGFKSGINHEFCQEYDLGSNSTSSHLASASSLAPSLESSL